MTEIHKIEPLSPGSLLAKSPAKVARFGVLEGHGAAPPFFLSEMRPPWLRRNSNQHSMKQSASRLPAGSRGWLADEMNLHPDKPSWIHLPAEMGGGLNGLRSLKASGMEMRQVRSKASTDLTIRSVNMLPFRGAVAGIIGNRSCIGSSLS
jgi:hypothetical protein